MAANYPASLPVKTAAGALLSTNPHSALHNKMFEEIVAISTELGLNPGGTSTTEYGTLDARVRITFEQNWIANSNAIGLRQGTDTAIANTVNYCRWRKSPTVNVDGLPCSGYGELIMDITATEASAASGTISLTYPSGANLSGPWGTFMAYDSSADRWYRGMAVSPGTASTDLHLDGGFLGSRSGDTWTVASGDRFIVYLEGKTFYFDTLFE